MASGSYNLELYVLDYDDHGRSEQIQFSNAVTGAVLSTESVASFSGGTYVKWTISGNVLITISNRGPANAVLSGLFLDSTSSPTPTPTPTPTSSATFLGTNTTTQGSWIGTYGAQGYDVIASGSSLPADVTVTPSGAATYTWANPTTLVNGLQVPPKGSTRIAAAWYSGSSFTVDVDVASGSYNLELYVLDYDDHGRSEQIQLTNAGTGAVLSTQTVSSFSGGTYMNWTITGNVLVTFTKTNAAQRRNSSAGCSSTRPPAHLA